jgi:ABC-2 type transport system permease protein
MLFFLCPIMYFSETVYYHTHKEFGNRGDFYYTLYHLNPIAMICTGYRKAWLAPVDVPIGPKIDGQVQQVQGALPMDWGLFLIAATISFGILVFGYNVFNRMKWRFVERP